MVNVLKMDEVWSNTYIKHRMSCEWKPLGETSLWKESVSALQDINDNAPVFNMPVYRATMFEDHALGTEVIR